MLNNDNCYEIIFPYNNKSLGKHFLHDEGKNSLKPSPVYNNYVHQI